MKYPKIFIAIVLFASVVFFAFTPKSTSRIKRVEGAPAGHTGSPGDSFKTCVTCHGGVLHKELNIITSNIPATGYESNQVYTITAKLSSFTANRFGFQISPQDLNGNLLGELMLTNSKETQLVGNGKYITYTPYGIVDSVIDQVTKKYEKVWQFNWKAPKKGTGEVIFYGAFNSNEITKGVTERIMSSTLKISENLVGKSPVIKNKKAAFAITINTNKTITIHNIQELKGMLGLEFFNTSGQLVYTHKLTLNNSFNKHVLPIGSLISGIYFVTLSVQNTTETVEIFIP